MNADRPRVGRGAIATIALVTALAIVGIVYLHFICDDAFISFRYADNLVHGRGLVFNPGERVEGYTNFLWLMAAAGMIAIGVPPEIGTLWLGGACALATLIVTMAHLARAGRNPVWFGLLLAGSPAFAAWATGGLETALFTLLIWSGLLHLIAALERTSNREGAPDRIEGGLWPGALLLCLASLTRPEGVLVTGLTGSFLVVRVARRRVSVRALLAWALAWLVPFTIYFVGRLAYFGRWLPNTFAVKAHGLSLLPLGLKYIAFSFERLYLHLPLVPLAVVALGRRRGMVSGDLLALAGIVVIPFLGYVALVGGDFMDLSRFLVPILPLAFYVMAGGCEAFVGPPTERRAFVSGIAVTGAVLVLYLGLNVRTAMESVKSWHDRSIDSIGLLREYAAEWRSVANLIGRISEPSDSIATTAAGIIPYYTRLYTIDQLGLVAKDLRDYRPRDSSMPGHGVVASGPLLIRLHPQFLLGHPTVVDELQKLRASLMIERGWVARVTDGYRVVGVQSSTTPPRYFALAVRPDVLARPARR